MPIGNINWDIRKTDGALSKDRGWALIILHSHSNAYGRCFPSQITLMTEIGCASQKLNAIIDWLVEHKAIFKVPLDARMGEEIKLNKRLTVYQLTGVIQLSDDAWLNYYYFDNEETMNSLIHAVGLVEDLTGVDEVRLKIKELYALKIKLLKIKDKGNKKSSEGSKKNTPNGAKPQSKVYSDFHKACAEIARYPVQSGVIGDYIAFFSGTAKKGEWKDYRIEPGATTKELQKFSSWLRKQYPDAQYRPRQPETLQAVFYEWREQKNAVPATPQLYTPPEITPASKDELTQLGGNHEQ